MGVLVEVGQFLLGLSILIILHEAGHFTAARIFKIRVEKFYLFFDPWFSLLKFKKGDTEYGIGWLPLGGYVKISGMIDESMDKEAMKQPPQPWEFRSKPGWQRLIVMVAGVTVNLLLGIVIYCGLIFSKGETYAPISSLPHGIYCDTLARSIGLQSSDIIVAIDNKPIVSFDSVMEDIILDKAKSIEVERDGKIVTLHITPDQTSLILSEGKTFISPLYTFSVDSLMPGYGALRGGIKKGDRITKIDTINTPYYPVFMETLQKFKNKDALFTVNSKGYIHTLTAHVDNDGKLGFYPKLDSIPEVHKSYTFFQSIPAGIYMGYIKLISVAKQLNVLITVKNAHKQMGSFISFAKAYGPVWDWVGFWNLTAFLSIMLAFLNILPIPALDGGHVIFLLYEMITGRKPNEKVIEYAQWVGMVILLALIIYANGLDINRLFNK